METGCIEEVKAWIEKPLADLDSEIDVDECTEFSLDLVRNEEYDGSASPPNKKRKCAE